MRLGVATSWLSRGRGRASAEVEDDAALSLLNRAVSKAFAALRRLVQKNLAVVTVAFLRLLGAARLGTRVAVPRTRDCTWRWRCSPIPVCSTKRTFVGDDLSPGWLRVDRCFDALSRPSRRPRIQTMSAGERVRTKNSSCLGQFNNDSETTRCASSSPASTTERSIREESPTFPCTFSSGSQNWGWARGGWLLTSASDAIGWSRTNVRFKLAGRSGHGNCSGYRAAGI